ncbi:hypothetical protein [Paraferrimonas sp. SM1919]|uniref:hypothetical protein n=1 Tax=Paraferrimonas sp. SM1919 TaxID=2662263 RepID=UPI0013D450DB|nr:hypothetical protein [Paraferrimonas sp. SM1919]
MINSYQSKLSHPGLWGHEIKSQQIQPVQLTIANAKEYQQVLPEALAKLSQLSQLGQWIMLVGNATAQFKRQLATAGVNLNRVLMVHPKDQFDAIFATEQAMVSKNCSAVIAFTETLNQIDVKRMQRLNKSARCATFVFQGVSACSLLASNSTQMAVYSTAELH